MINAFDKWELAPGNRTRSVRTNEIAQTPLEVSIEGSRTLISHLPSALIINHQSVLNSHPTRRCQVCIRPSLQRGGGGRPGWSGLPRLQSDRAGSDLSCKACGRRPACGHDSERRDMLIGETK